jgi:putative transposase
VKYQFIQDNQGKYDTHVMARVLSINPQAFRAWKRRGASQRKQEDAVLIEQIKQVHQDSQRTYGAPRIKARLEREGTHISRTRTNRLMRQAGCQTKYRRKFVTTTNSSSTQNAAPNRLNREFQASRPNEKWVSDMTYLPTSQGWLYLAVVLDLYSRKVVGWAFSTKLETSIVLDALGMARVTREPGVEAGLLHHSDRGSQYASFEYRQALKALRADCSMSRVGNCWDNAVVESFFNTLKLELSLDSVIGDQNFTCGRVFAWVEGWYNRCRLHSSLGYLSPVDFEARFLN